MCGIFGLVSKDVDTLSLTVEGLRRQEYRGYDSTGIAFIAQEQLCIHKKEGKLKKMLSTLQAQPTFISVGHTRWATHGDPCDKNAHPLVDNTGSIALVHNGIIENYNELKQELSSYGYTFQSDTDTEVLVNLISYLYTSSKGKYDLYTATREALKRVTGSYAICVISTLEPDSLVIAKNKSPLILGCGNNLISVASDKIAFTKEVEHLVYLEDGEIGNIYKDASFVIYDLAGQRVEKQVETHIDDWSSSKGKYPHFMLKEIEEQPQTIQDTLNHLLEKSPILMKDSSFTKFATTLKRIVIVACGTSWHAGLLGKHYMEKYLRIPVEVCYASEFRYNNPIVDENTIFIFITQSGETADIIAALEEAKQRGGKTLAICNVEKSSITRLADFCLFTKAGIEIGVASTKAFVAQLIALFVLTKHLADYLPNVKPLEVHIAELQKVHSLIARQLIDKSNIIKIAHHIKNFHHALFLGRGNLFPIALEGALKMKEISYIHAEGYPAAEMKHGHIALIDNNLPVVCLLPRPETLAHKKMISNIQEIKARGGNIISVISEGDTIATSLSTYTISVPQYEYDFLAPLLMVVPLQLLAYHTAVALGRDVDQPRNLAKSVTVE